MGPAYPGEQRATADGVWVGVKAAKKKAGLPIGAYRISSAIGRIVVAYCAVLHDATPALIRCIGAGNASNKGGSGLLGSVLHNRVARLKGAYPVTLAKQVAEQWRQQGWRGRARHRQDVVSGMLQNTNVVSGKIQMWWSRGSWRKAGAASWWQAH